MKLFVSSLMICLLGSAVAAAPLKPAAAHWVGTWACAPTTESATDKNTDKNDANTTFRDVVHISLGGHAVRIKLSNTFGTTSLIVGATHVALSAGNGKIVPGSDHTVTFGGVENVTIPPGALAVSDPIALPVPALSDLVVSAFLPDQTLSALTGHTLGSSWTYRAVGNQVSAVEMENATKEGSWMLLTGVDIAASGTAAAVVTLGDSITDGAHSTPNQNARWPDVLAARLHANAATANLGVLNVGISGNRILHDKAGTGALARLDRDVLAQSGVKYLIVLEGINDVRYASNPRTPDDVVTAQQLIWAMGQIIGRAHARGLKVFGATLTPFMGSRNANDAGEMMRLELNKWIRTSGAFDAVLDFDLAARAPEHTEQFWPGNDSGDHLHPSDVGYKAMADSIDLKLFQ